MFLIIMAVDKRHSSHVDCLFLNTKEFWIFAVTLHLWSVYPFIFNSLRPLDYLSYTITLKCL